MGAFAAIQIHGMRAGLSEKYLSKPAAFHSNDATSTKIPVQGDLIGTLTIAALRATLPIYEGTDDNSLKKGVGHFIGSVMPGVQDNSVLSGHRDSVFQHLGALKLGELLVVNTASGTFTYKIIKFRIVGADDRTVIVPTPSAILTLTTCYPFIFVGHAPKRFIVSAAMISSVSPS